MTVAVLVLAACGPSEACQRSCSRLGMELDSEACDTLCTTDCEEFAEDYGATVEACERLQRGE